MLLRIVLLWALWLMTGFRALGQRYTFYNLNIEQGLVQSQVRDLAQDSRGFIWMATIGGLSRYDGRTFRNYTVRDGLPANAILSVRATPDGTIWLGTANGLCRLVGNHVQTFSFGRKPGQKRGLVMMDTDTLGRVWFLHEGSIYRLEANKIVRVPVPGVATAISAWKPTADGAVWVGTQDGRCIWYKDGKARTYYLPNKSGEPVAAIRFLEDRQHRLWVGATNGLFRIQNAGMIPARIRGLPGGLKTSVFSLLQDNSGNIWAGLRNGAMRLQDSTATFFGRRNGFTDNGVPKVFQDAEGNIWLGSDGQGVFRYSGTQFTMLDETSGLPNAQVISIGSDRSGNLYFGAYDAGLSVYDGYAVKRLNFPAGNAVSVSSMAWYRGALWIGTGGSGLWRYNGQAFFAVSLLKARLASPLIARLVPDDYGRLWIGAFGGASYLKNDTFRAIPLPRQTSVQDFLILNEDSALLGTGAGLKLFDGQKLTDFTTGTTADHSAIQCIARNKDLLLIGTNENGIIYYNLKTQRAAALNKGNGLKSDFVYNLTVDNQGDVWVGTGFGIHRVRFRGNDKPEVRVFGRSDGVAGMESNQHAALKLRDGSIWFGTINGAYHYNPKEQLQSRLPVSLAMQQVAVFGEPVRNKQWFQELDAAYGVPKGLRLPFRKNNVTFTFGAICMNGQEAIRYRYRLTGLDAPWSEWATNNTITFSALPPGNFVLEVQAATERSGPHAALRYPFEIITPFHKTRWFRLLVLTGCILLGVTIQYLANRRHVARQRLIEQLRQEEQAKVRQRTAEDFHDEVGNKLTRINILTNILEKKIDLNPESQRIIRQIQENTALVYNGTRDILWSLKPENDNLNEILLLLRDFGHELFADTPILFQFSEPDGRWQHYRLPMDVSRNLVMIFKEAMNNALKYSGATEVKLEVTLKKDNALQLVLTDNGKGFDVQYIKRGHGINNMQVRSERIGGRIYIDARKDKGTIINLTFRLPKKFTSGKG